MAKILTVCRGGLVRSVGLADVLKLHFEPVDVVPIGYAEHANGSDTIQMLCDWADHIVVMEPHIIQKLEKRMGIDNMQQKYNVHVCDVGPDTYGGRHNRRHILIHLVWTWARANQDKLGITEHSKSV